MKLERQNGKSSVDRQIDENLKRVYREALDEGIPDKFRDLIEKLKAGEASRDDK